MRSKPSELVLFSLLGLFLVTEAQAQVTGIKIKSSSFDSANHLAKLTFINDTPSNITAWGYCVNVQNEPGDSVNHNSCRLVDPLLTAISNNIDEQARPSAVRGNCPDCQFIHPGEEKTILSGYQGITNGRIEIALVAYSDGTIEVAPTAAARELQQDLVSSRQGQLRVAQKLVTIAAQILSDASNDHPASTMIQELQSRVSEEPSLEGVLRKFRRPEWRKGDEREFVPSNEREYLERFIAEEKIRTAELAKNQLKGGQ